MAELFSCSVNMCSFHRDAMPSAGQETSDMAVNKPGLTSLDSGEPEHFSVRFTKGVIQPLQVYPRLLLLDFIKKRKRRKGCLSLSKQQVQKHGHVKVQCVQGQCWVVGHRECGKAAER